MKLEIFNRLLQFLWKHDFRVVIIEGPRGIGKTALCNKLLSATDMTYYKTWGKEQKWLRHDMERLYNLDLPQGTHFVLDFLSQVSTKHPVLADRGNLSALVYQNDKVWGKNPELNQYYYHLMKECNAVLLYLTGPPKLIYDRRVNRAAEDEEADLIGRLSVDDGVQLVGRDLDAYDRAMCAMYDVGLKHQEKFYMDEGVELFAFYPRLEAA